MSSDSTPSPAALAPQPEPNQSTVILSVNCIPSIGSGNNPTGGSSGTGNTTGK